MVPDEAERKVFLVHGWDRRVRREISGLFGIARIPVIEWDEAMQSQTGTGPANNWENLRKSIKEDARKIVVLYTPDEQSTSTLFPETPVELRPRPNVLYELGLAHAWRPDDTITITFGFLPPSDLDGIHRFEWTADPTRRFALLKWVTGQDPVYDPAVIDHPMDRCDELANSALRISALSPEPVEAPIEAPPAPEEPDVTAPRFRHRWPGQLDALVLRGRLHLVTADGVKMQVIDVASGQVHDEVTLPTPLDEVELTHDGFFACARAGNVVWVYGVKHDGHLVGPWEPVRLGTTPDAQLLTAEGRGSSVRLLMTSTDTYVYEAADRSSHMVTFPSEPLAAAAATPDGFLTVGRTDTDSPWHLVDSATKARTTMTVWAAGANAVVERRDEAGSERRQLALTGPADHVAVARPREPEAPTLVLASIAGEVLGWDWDDLPRDPA